MFSLKKVARYSVGLFYTAVVVLLCFFYVKLLDDWKTGLKTTIEVENITKNKAAYSVISKLQKNVGCIVRRHLWVHLNLPCCISELF